jgi:hypothetical protein
LTHTNVLADGLETPIMTSSRKGWAALLAAFLGWMFDGMEMGIFPLVARPALKHMQTAAHIVDEGFVQVWMGIVTGAFLRAVATSQPSPGIWLRCASSRRWAWAVNGHSASPS